MIPIASQLADLADISAFLNKSWNPGSYVLTQILVSTHAPQFRMKWFHSEILLCTGLRSCWYAFTRNQENRFGSIGFALSLSLLQPVARRLHGHTIPLLLSHTPSPHEHTVGSWAFGLSFFDGHIYHIGFTERFEASTMFFQLSFGQASSPLLDPPWINTT